MNKGGEIIIYVDQMSKWQMLSISIWKSLCFFLSNKKNFTFASRNAAEV